MISTIKMSDAVQIAIIVALGPTLIGLASCAVSLINGRKIDDVHKTTNSRLDELIASTKLASHAEGMSDQRAQTKREQEKVT